MAQTTTVDRPALVAPRAENPFAGNTAVARPTGAVAIEQQRAVAEIQARLVVARANPRDPVRAVDRILNDCARPTLANAAVYQYSRGGTDIRGPTIRLAEAIAQRWGNIASGIKEIGRHDGYSECIAYAWDLESGFYDERQFQVCHWRDRSERQGGGYALTDERDIYELIANFGQRRKRAVLLTVIPGDVTEAALEQCEATMQAGADVTAEGIAKLIAAFATLGVEPAQIEARIQRRIDAIRPAQIVILRKIYNSISDGISQPADWFDPTGEGDATESGRAAPPNPAGTQLPAAGSAPTPRRRGRPSGPRKQPDDPAAAAADTAPDSAAPAPTPETSQPQARGRVNFEV